MQYHILNPDGGRIASFENTIDREICLDALQEFFGEDCEFTTEDND